MSSPLSAASVRRRWKPIPYALVDAKVRPGVLSSRVRANLDGPGQALFGAGAVDICGGKGAANAGLPAIFKGLLTRLSDPDPWTLEAVDDPAHWNVAAIRADGRSRPKVVLQARLETAGFAVRISPFGEDWRGELPVVPLVLIPGLAPFYGVELGYEEDDAAAEAARLARRDVCALILLLVQRLHARISARFDVVIGDTVQPVEAVEDDGSLEFFGIWQTTPAARARHAGRPMATVQGMKVAANLAAMAGLPENPAIVAIEAETLGRSKPAVGERLRRSFPHVRPEAALQARRTLAEALDFVAPTWRADPDVVTRMLADMAERRRARLSTLPGYGLVDPVGRATSTGEERLTAARTAVAHVGGQGRAIALARLLDARRAEGADLRARRMALLLAGLVVDEDEVETTHDILVAALDAAHPGWRHVPQDKLFGMQVFDARRDTGRRDRAA